MLNFFRWAIAFQRVNFYPLTHRIFVKTKNQILLYFSEHNKHYCRPEMIFLGCLHVFAKKKTSRIWFLLFAKIRWVKGQKLTFQRIWQPAIPHWRAQLSVGSIYMYITHLLLRTFKCPSFELKMWTDRHRWFVYSGEGFFRTSHTF